MLYRFKHTVVAGLAAVLIFISGAQAQQLSPGLTDLARRVAGGNTADSLVEVVVFLDDFEAKQAVFRISESRAMSRAERIRSVIHDLKAYRPPNRKGVIAYIKAHAVANVTEHWLAPAFTATLPVSSLAVLSEMEGVKLVVENVALVYEEPVKISPTLSTSSLGISAELGLLKVTELWKRGLKGKGRLVCSFDTGVEQSHPALSSKWRGNHTSLSTAWFSKIAPDVLPYDLLGHGTHTMGVMVGAAEADSFGVAPEAEWITAGVIDQGRTLSMTISDILEAFQWALNPDYDENTVDDVPDVILNSWGFPKDLFSPCDDTFWGIIDYVEAAGIVTVFSAGNEGPSPMTMRSPADRATSPINSFAVGAVDNSKLITSFSSRGPSSCDTTQIKPEVVAPGVNIRSSFKDASYALMSGTSMAAPYIAGLVALIRQYNPDATVEEIKYALISACEDLGPGGNDNAYGHGFVDASRVLDYIPAPSVEGMDIVGYRISGDGLAMPGESFGLQLVLNPSDDSVDHLVGTIETGMGGVLITAGTADFYYTSGVSTALNETPFEITFDSAMYHGQSIEFDLLVSFEGTQFFDTLAFTLTVGIAPPGKTDSHENERVTFTVSDFGQFGFAPGSIYNTMGEGFRFDGSDNLIYEAGLVAACDSTHLARSIRDQSGLLRPSDFYPAASLTGTWTGIDGGIHRTAAYNDGTGQVPLTIGQETIHYDGFDDAGFILIRFTLNNSSSERLSGLCFGLFADFDLSLSDKVVYDDLENVIYQQGQGGPLVGLTGLENISVYYATANGDCKRGLAADELYSIISAPQTTVPDEATGDMMLMVSSPRLIIDPLRAVKVSYALVAGNSVEELMENVRRARERFSEVVRADVGGPQAREALRLFQNFPNPFNPVTNISFSLAEGADVSLDVFNILGRRVRRLHSGFLPAGHHQFLWNAADEQGNRVANGVYFYRLSNGDSSVSKKMILLK
ncbi:MAG: S8 family serine peptidase [Candidatus Zixiibacteriota bacterium]|nr:MAG: S8 family serine peptidase [candidate division Zixibacteria bacterium]